MKFDTKNCASAKARPQTNAAGQVARKPRTPSTMNTRTKRHEEADHRALTADHRAEHRVGLVGHEMSVVIGTASAPKATGAVSATSATLPP